MCSGSFSASKDWRLPECYTTNLFIKNQVLYVSLSSSVIRQELMMGREMLIRNLNAQVGSQVIVNIVFR